MHLLNTLPQRLDPGATPTFAGLIAPSLTSPASSPLTLGTGTSGAAVTVLSADNNVGIGTTSPAYKLQITDGSATNYGIGFNRGASTINDAYPFEQNFKLTPDGVGFMFAKVIGARDTGSSYASYLGFYTENKGSGSTDTSTEKMRINAAGNVLIGTIDATGLTGAGGLKIASTTAGSSGAGALVVAGGLATGAASYIGGNLTVSTGRINGTANGVGIMGAATSDTALTAYGTTSDSTKFALVAKDSGGNNLFLVRNDGAATFAGAVTAAVVTSTGAGYTNSGFQITNTSASRTTGFFLTNAGLTTIRDVTGSADLFTISTLGNATFGGTVSPQQATTAAAPTYVKGAIYFDTTLNKLRVGGATAWETITSA